ncbi:hypothetical protein GYMLUDRAFT_250202 [Collybiopsis luxurians FD-317 M1]|uniref:Uncharacterized protein n=1 Tax=Collybiopsis luxurians FD-317 M1 TaxID=944289 RepID=A0A0D0BVE2_9AGAR|nr:hypothetical protein GYMLUDRAFT_250202 [Collybiopsis luxurians FD-317 M1]
MQFSSIFFAVIIAALASTSNACKCVINGGSHPEATGPCCSQLNGDFDSSDGDCAAGSISEHLSNFRSCCQTWLLNNVPLTSDCDFPKALADVEKIDTPQGEGIAVKA